MTEEELELGRMGRTELLAMLKAHQSKVKELTSENAELIDSLKQAFHEMNLLQARINELTGEW